jgi:hypothetical protein
MNIAYLGVFFYHTAFFSKKEGEKHVAQGKELEGSVGL